MSDQSDNSTPPPPPTQSSSGSDEVRVPRIVIPIGIDTGEFDVWLETLKNSKLLKDIRVGAGSESSQTQATPAAAVAAGESSRPTAQDALLAGMSMKLDNIESILKSIDNKMDAVIMGANN